MNPSTGPLGRANASMFVTCLFALCLAVVSLAATPSAAGQPQTQASSLPGAVDTSWSALNSAHQRVLAPLAAQWSTLDHTSRQKWINVAERYPRLSPSAQQRMRERMTQWAGLPAQQRGEARLRFQNSRQLSIEERQQKWTAYQALQPEERRDLAKQAHRKQRPVVMSDAEPGPRESSQSSGRRNHPRHEGRKANVVPNPLHGGGTPEAVAPSLVKAGAGATTTLVNQTATPPLHQHTGLAKISATKGFVDPETLLPRKGQQGAGMTPVVPTASPEPDRRRGGKND